MARHGLQGPCAIMKRVRDGTEGRDEASGLASGADLGSFFGRDRGTRQEHSQPQGGSRYHNTLWDRGGSSRGSSVDLQSYANLGLGFSKRPVHPTEPQVHKSSKTGSASSNLPDQITKGAASDGSSRENVSSSSRTGSVGYGATIESTDEFESSIETNHNSPPSDVRPVRHIYRYAHYDEFGSGEIAMQWQSGDEDFSAGELDLREYFSSLGEVPSTPDEDGCMRNSGGAGKIYQSQTSTENDQGLRAQFNEGKSQARDGDNVNRLTTESAPSILFQTRGGGFLGESQENTNSVSSVGSMLESRSSEKVKNASDDSVSSKSRTVDTTGEIMHHGSQSSEKASFPDLDQENKVCGDGKKPPVSEENVGKVSDTTTHANVKALSVLRDLRSLENEKEIVKARTAEIRNEIMESLRGSHTSADEPRKETGIANTRTIEIQTGESLILSKAKIVKKQEKVRLNTSTQTSSMEPIPQKPKEKQLDGTKLASLSIDKDQQSGTEWLSEMVPKELLDRFGLGGIANRTARTVPDQFHLHLHFTEKEPAVDSKIKEKAEHRGNEVARDNEQPLQHHSRSLSPKEEMQPQNLKEPCHRVAPGRPALLYSDGGDEQVRKEEASWDVLRTLCKRMGNAIDVACQNLSQSETTTDTDQSVHGDFYDHDYKASRDESIYDSTPRRSCLSEKHRRRTGQDDHNHSNRAVRTQAAELQDSYQRDEYHNHVDYHEKYQNAEHCERERELSHLQRHQSRYKGEHRRNMSPKDSQSRNFHGRTQNPRENDRRYHNGFSAAAMDRFGSSQRGMNVDAPRGAAQSQYPRYIPSEEHFQPADDRHQYTESYMSDVNSLPSIFSPAGFDRSIDEAEERWRAHQEHLIKKLRQANRGSSGDPRAKRRMDVQNRQSGNERSSSTALQRVVRDMDALSHRLQKRSRE
ncbi:hypothetical protein BSKO_07030 [Bryopsis sp. KO-2023]|nr:hypothetical protein BSKO_07030 [Bryopsis sp. KO-2023]